MQSLTRYLEPNNAVAAIIRTHQKEFLFQLRNSIEGIFYPGFLGCFGGAIDGQESDEEALIREIEEELSIINFRDIDFYTMKLDFSPIRKSCVYRKYFVINLNDKNLKDIKFKEGADLVKIKFEDLFSTSYSIVPYDAFALDLYLASNHV